MDKSSEEKHMPSVSPIKCCLMKPSPSAMNATRSPTKLSSRQISRSHHSFNPSTLLKKVSNRFGRHYYSRKNSSSKGNTQSSNNTNTPPTSDVKTLHKPSSTHPTSEPVKDGGSKATASSSHEMVVSKSVVAAPNSTHRGKMVCGLCMKLLRRRLPCLMDDAITSNNLPVVAILFCGHVFHAECLEQTTPELNTQDPPCPSCNANGRLFYAISEGEEV